jgi:hypothetical protein
MEQKVDGEGRGLMMYINKDLNYQLLSIQEYEQASEAQAVALRISNHQEVLICSIYRSPNSDGENDNRINMLLHKLAASKFEFKIIFGDFNYPGIDWENMTNTRREIDKAFRFVETIKDCFFIQHVNTPTRGRGLAEPSLLDLLITDSQIPAPEIEYAAPLGKSDHCLIQANFNMQPQRNEYAKMLYNYRKADLNRMRQELDINWETELGNLMTTEEMWTNIKDRILRAEKKCVPLIKIRKQTEDFTTG